MVSAGAHPALLVREHPAPSGALRQLRFGALAGPVHQVGKRPAPSGALRPQAARAVVEDDIRGRAHPALSGALRLRFGGFGNAVLIIGPGVPSTIRCVEAPLRVWSSGRSASAWNDGC